MTATVNASDRLDQRSAAAAVTGLFAINGLMIGGIGGSLPALRDRLGIGAGGLAALLFCLAGAAVLSMQIGGRLADARGGRLVVLTTVPMLAIGVLLLGLAPSFPLAMLTMLLAGLGNGATDVSMNALGVQVEAARPRPIMSFFHAFFSIGSLAGASANVTIPHLLGVTRGDAVGPVLVTLGLAALAVYAAVFRIVPRGSRVEHVLDGVRIKLPKLAWVLGAMAFCFGMAEGTAVDWSSVHVTDVGRVDPATGALGLVAVSGCMVVIRLLGDRAVSLFGRRTAVRAGGAAAVVGYVVTLLAQPVPVLLIGWALVGLGVGMVAPQVYAVAGHTGGGRMLAVVVTFGYAAFLVGPAIIGTLVHWFGVQHAMLFPLLLAASLAILAAALPRDAGTQ